MYKLTLFLCLLVLSPVDARSSSGGGRGFSAGRVASAPSSGSGFGGAPSGGRPAGGFHPQTNTAFRPAGNQGFHPQQNNQPSGGFHGGAGGFQQNNRGFNQQPHVNSAPHFASGTGPGSASRGSTFKSALAGAAIGTIGGLAAFEIGKAIIHSASTPFQHNNNNYYWGQQYYQQKPGQFMCKMPLEQLIKESTPSTTTTTTTVAPDGVTADPNAVTTTPSPNTVLSSLQFADGTRPKEVVWSCRQGAEICCGTECCPAPVQQNPSGASSSHGGGSIAAIVLGVLLVMLLIACCCFAAYKLCRSSIECCLPSSNSQDPRHDQYDQSYKYDDAQSYPQQQSYPMQPYNNQQQQHYNNQPQAYSAPQQYPSYPQPSYVPPPKY